MTDEQRYQVALDRILTGCRSMKVAEIWSIANEALFPEPQTETVEVVNYAINLNGWVLRETFSARNSAEQFIAEHGGEIIELRGSYERPIKPKVKRREQVRVMDVPDMPVEWVTIDLGRPWINGSKIFHEWEE